MDLPYSIEILENCNGSPPPNSVDSTSTPFTFFDMLWILLPPVERILFYEFPHPTLHFTQTILPQLKHSLSLTLQHFFPLAGSLVCPPFSTDPHILYQNGDSIPLTIAESNSDFDHLVKNCPRDAREFRPLVPHLSHETVLSSSDTDKVAVQLIRPLIALQVTIFPNSGISICFAYRHVVGDGRTMNQFIKSWAAIFKSKNDLSLQVQPFHDRTVLDKHTNELLPIMYNQWREFGVSRDNFTTATAAATSTSTDIATLQDKLHATFVFDRRDITKLRHWITSQFKNFNEPPPLSHVSTFVATCAFIWVCLIKTENVVEANIDTVSSEDNVFYYFNFLADCTDRTELQVPKTYFGNCLSLCGTSIRKCELLSKNGLLIAATAIMKEIKDLKSGLLRKAERWLPECGERFSSGHFVSVAGSPKLRVYETDFGWGRPKKSEVVHIDKSAGSISLTESRDEEGGVEVGLALNKVGMDVFTSIFEQGRAFRFWPTLSSTSGSFYGWTNLRARQLAQKVLPYQLGLILHLSFKGLDHFGFYHTAGCHIHDGWSACTCSSQDFGTHFKQLAQKSLNDFKQLA